MVYRSITLKSTETIRRTINMAVGYTPKQIKSMIDQYQKGVDVGNIVTAHPRNANEAKGWTYEFWETQPVTQMNKKAALPRIINESIRDNYTDKQTETKLPDKFSWKDYTNRSDDVCQFLNKYYKSDTKFVQVFTPEYLKFAIPEKNGEILAVEAGGKICAIICMTTNRMQLFDKEKDVVHVPFICIHPKLRTKNLFNVLIEEVKRRYLSKDGPVEIGYFTTSVYIPTPVCRTENYNRPINYEKLYDTGFVKMEKVEELAKAIEEYVVHKPKKYDYSPTIVPLSMENSQRVYEILCEYQNKYNVHNKYSYDEFCEVFLNKSVVKSYVLLEKDEITDFFSFYTYMQRNVQNDKTIKTAKMFLYTSDTITPLTIFKYAIYYASKDEADLFVCTDSMENLEVVYDNFNKFTRGNTITNYNFYNWETAEMSPEQLCLTPINQ